MTHFFCVCVYAVLWCLKIVKRNILIDAPGDFFMSSQVLGHQLAGTKNNVYLTEIKLVFQMILFEFLRNF